MYCKYDLKYIFSNLSYLTFQEPKTDKDEEYCRKVNEYVNNPPIPGTLGSGGSSSHELSALGGISEVFLSNVLIPFLNTHFKSEVCIFSVIINLPYTSFEFLVLIIVESLNVVKESNSVEN